MSTGPQDFERVFGAPPVAVGQAPGRVNLLGEHTDYNDGFVLPVAIPQQTRVSLRPNGTPQCRLYAAMLEQMAYFDFETLPSQHFAHYVYGCLVEARRLGISVRPLDIHVESSVPMGVGLSSSAALEVATLRALRELTGAPLDDVRIAQVAQQAEIVYAGVRCGIMDQMAASLASTAHALLLDTRSLERRLVALPSGSAVLVLDSGIARTLAGSGYNQRRAECEEAARLLGVKALRDVADAQLLETLPQPLRRRASHVVSENERVLRAAQDSDAVQFGALMNASHASLRDDYEVSVPELDRLVGLLQRQPAVFGARLTGAGFGGACVALCRSDALQQVADDVLRAYADAGGQGRMLVPPAPAYAELER
jgi:galactokinase